VYAGQGFNFNGTQIIRLDANGNYDNFMTAQHATWREVWDMGVHCSTGKVYGMGGSTSSTESAGIVDPSSANLTPIAFFTGTATSGHDVASHAIDDAGEFFWVYSSFSEALLDNHIARINSIFTSMIWVAPTTFNTLSEASNKGFFGPPAYGGSNGLNCLAVNANFLFYYDGLNLAAYNKTNGSLVSATTLTGQVAKNQAGIAVDNCNNLYLGGVNSIKCYNFNGTAFTALTPIPTGASSPTANVTDIKLDKNSNLLYLSGKYYAGTYNAIHSNTCTVPSQVCVNTFPMDYSICAGSSASIVPVNYYNLSNAVYSLAPLGLSNTTGTFVVSPSAFATYTAYITGTNSVNAQFTHSTLVYVVPYAQPVISPTFTQMTCTSPTNAINLNLSFNPGPVTYSVAWSPVPFGISSATQYSTSGGITPGNYAATVTSQNGCTVATTFSVSGGQAPAIFNISPPGGHYSMNCSQPSVAVNFVPATYNYTCTHATAPPVTGATAVFTGTPPVGTWTCFAVNPVSGCTSTQTFAITSNTSTPSSTVMPLSTSINCSSLSIVTISAYVTASPGIVQQWMSPFGGALSIAAPVSTFIPGGPGTYTHCALDSASGCRIWTTFTVSSVAGFPTFSLTSPQQFTLGCGTRSVANISMSNAQTTPAGGPLSYTMLGPPTSQALPPGILSGTSTYTVNVPGTWTFVTRDNSNFCDTRVVTSVIQNTIAPNLGVNVPYNVLSCDLPVVTLEGVSSTSNVAFVWLFAGVPGSLSGSTITIPARTLSPTSTVVANYTLSITDNNNTCESRTVVPLYQNISPPAALITGASEITCATPTVMLSNASSSSVPPVFNPSKQVIGYLWEGPSPQVPLQLSSSYIGFMPGTYTLTIKDLNNGCMSASTKTIADSRIYPVVNNPAPAAFTLDCGMPAVKIYPAVANPLPGYTYSWDVVSNATVSGNSTPTLTTNRSGLYIVNVLNPANGCGSIGFVDVVEGALKAEFVAEPARGIAPLKVNVTNHSASSLNSASITSVWMFGEGTQTITQAASATASVVYNAPGTYTLTLWATKGKCLDSAATLVNVEIPSSLEIPNVFSPNGDQVNDLFFLKLANLSELHFTIYDRWGQLVYELANGPNIAWDGRNQYGKNVAEGTYYYTVKAKGRDGKDFEMKGNVTLVR
jgi:gliding motility-associated-like protein